MMGVARHWAGLKTKDLSNGEWTLSGQLPSSTMVFCNNAYSRCSDKTASLGRGIPKLKTVKVEGSLDRINGHVSVFLTSLQVGGHWLWYILGRGGIHLVYLPKTLYVWINTFAVFNPDMWNELTRCSVARRFTCSSDWLWWWIFKYTPTKNTHAQNNVIDTRLVREQWCLQFLKCFNQLQIKVFFHWHYD